MLVGPLCGLAARRPTAHHTAVSLVHLYACACACALLGVFMRVPVVHCLVCVRVRVCGRAFMQVPLSSNCWCGPQHECMILSLQPSCDESYTSHQRTRTPAAVSAEGTARRHPEHSLLSHSLRRPCGADQQSSIRWPTALLAHGMACGALYIAARRCIPLPSESAYQYIPLLPSQESLPVVLADRGRRLVALVAAGRRRVVAVVSQIRKRKERVVGAALQPSPVPHDRRSRALQ
jgi:hypothetical protein